MGLIYSKADGGTEPPPMPNFASIGAAASAALKREKWSNPAEAPLHACALAATLTAEAGCDRVRQGERAASIKNHAPSCFPSM
eukprot:scaffold139851_cov21-Tisochrysis_lutea.AAC.2